MATVAAYESKVLERLIPHLNAGEDLSSYQYCAMKLSSGDVVKCDTLGEFTIGILQNAPDASGKGADVCYGTCISRVKLGGTVSQLNRLVAGASATLVAQSDPDEAVIAIALSDGVSGDVIPAIVCQGTALNSAVAERALADGKIWMGNGSGEAAAVTMSGDATITDAGVITVADVTVGSDAAGDILYKSSATALTRLAKGTANQLLAMNSGATAPEWIDQSAVTPGSPTNVATTSAGDATGDILYRDAADTLERLAEGTANDLLQQGGSNAPQWATISGDATIADGGAVTVIDVTVGSDAAGDILYKSSATALARLAKGTTADVLQQGSSNAPQWATLSGDATIADGGAVTVTDVTVGSDATGDILYKSSATTLARLGEGTANDILQQGGSNAPQWATVSGDATIADGGAVTLSKDLIRTTTVEIAAAAVKTMNATPVVLIDFSALVSSGEAASGDALVFHGAILNIYGGAASYDNNENTTIVYQTAGGGATVSLTLANFFNGGADGALTTLKPIATDVAPDADEDLVIKSSASPYSAQGDRNLYVQVFYSIFTPHA